MSKKGIQQGEEALAGLTKFLSYVRIKKLLCFATAPLRGIDNADEVKAHFEKICKTPITILSGEEEAEIDFLGAKQNLENMDGLVVDIGGGSTELVYYVGGKMQQAHSIPVGSLTMYRKYVKDIIPSKEERDVIMEKIEKELEALPIPRNLKIICGIGGSVRGCGKLLRYSKRLKSILHDKRKSDRYTPKDIQYLIEMKKSTLVDLILKEEPERIHTIIPGSCILLAIADYVHAEKIIVSKAGVREGYLLNYLAQEGAK